MMNHILLQSIFYIGRNSILLILLSVFSSHLLAETKSIVIIGDSLSAAHGINPAASWPRLLQKKLESNKLPYKVINTSISGDTSYTALNRNEKNLSQFNPEICFIAIGANDGLQGLSLTQLRQNLLKLVQLCKRYTNKILLFEMKLPLNYGPAFVNRFTNVYHQVAKEENVSLLPFFMEPFARDLSMFLPDRIHPSESAQPVMLDIVWKGLLKLIR